MKKRNPRSRKEDRSTSPLKPGRRKRYTEMRGLSKKTIKPKLRFVQGLGNTFENHNHRFFKEKNVRISKNLNNKAAIKIGLS